MSFLDELFGGDLGWLTGSTEGMSDTDWADLLGGAGDSFGTGGLSQLDDSVWLSGDGLGTVLDESFDEVLDPLNEYGIHLFIRNAKCRSHSNDVLIGTDELCSKLVPVLRILVRCSHSRFNDLTESKSRQGLPELPWCY